MVRIVSDNAKRMDDVEVSRTDVFDETADFMELR